MSNRHGLSAVQICEIRKTLQTFGAANAFEQDVEDSVRREENFEGLNGWHLRSATAAVARHVWRQLKKRGVQIGEGAVKAFLWDNQNELAVMPLSQMYIF